MKLKEITREELFAMLESPEVATQVEAQMKRPGVDALVVFENLHMGSSNLGASTIMIVGAPYTYKSVEECEGRWLFDLPSQRQYATSFCRMPKQVEGAVGDVVR